MIADVLIGLAKANLAGAAATLAVLALRRAVRPRFGARAAYALWIVPVIAAAAALSPHPASTASAPRMMEPIVIQAEAATEAFVAQAATPSGPDLLAILLATWVVGGLLAAGLLARRQMRFVQGLGRLTPLAEPGLFRAERAGVGPAVVGVLRPKVVAPADFEARFAPDERALILAHEQAHLRTGDALANAAACAIQCLCWFNPLAHLAARLMRVDQELACDAAVVGRFPEQRRAYAELLLKTQLTTQPLPLGCHWPAGAEHPLKERIAMLKSPLPELSMRAAGLAVAGLLSIGAGGLAWAATPGASALEATGPGPAERAAAKALDDLHPNYSCDRAIENRGGGCKVIRVQSWLAVPTHADIMRHYPPVALKAGATASVVMTCEIIGRGRLTACRAKETAIQSPDGAAAIGDLSADFGQAAVSLSRYYQTSVLDWVPRSQRQGGHATLRVVFNPDPSAIGRQPGPAGSLPAPPAQVSRATPTVSRLLAAFAGPDSTVVTKPNWLRKPDVRDIARLYPAGAAAANIAADTMISCRIANDGRLTACGLDHVSVVGDNLPQPGADPDFAGATLELSKLFQLAATDRDGHPTAGRMIRIPIRWAPGGKAVPATKITKADWLEKPTGADLKRFYPPEAAKLNLEGTTTLTCRVAKDGRLTDCTASDIATFGVPDAIREDFRKATLALAPQFRMRPQMIDGEPTAGGQIRIPIHFALPTDPAAKARLDALRDPGPAPSAD